MAFPTLGLYIAFQTTPFVATPTWTDVSSTLRAIHIRRGRQHELNRIEAGVAVFEVDNTSGDFYPTGGAYSPNVLPGKLIQCRAVYNSITYYLFTGFIEAYTPKWLGASGMGAIMELHCSDLIRNLSGLLLNDAGEVQELSGTRVGNVLDTLGWLGGRDIATGQSQIIATGAQANVNAMSHLFDVQTSELGLLFIAGDGDVQFHDRATRLQAPYTVSQGIFGDDPGELGYTDIVLSYDDEFIFNDVRITRSGGTEQASSDGSSITAYGKRSLSRTALLMTTDLEAKDQADFLCSRYKDPSLRMRSMTILPSSDETNLYPKVLSFDISTRITTRLDAASLDKEYYIEGVNHDCTASERFWKTTWELSDADMQMYWFLGTAGASELGETTRLGY